MPETVICFGSGVWTWDDKSSKKKKNPSGPDYWVITWLIHVMDSHRNIPEFVGGSDNTESACKGGDRFNPWVRRWAVGCEGFHFCHDKLAW